MSFEFQKGQTNPLSTTDILFTHSHIKQVKKRTVEGWQCQEQPRLLEPNSNLTIIDKITVQDKTQK